MKALTLYQPHAALVALGEKKLETRDWAPEDGYTGPLLIHAGENSPTHDEWMLRWMESPIVMDLYGKHRPALAENRQGISLFSSGVLLAACDLVRVRKIVRAISPLRLMMDDDEVLDLQVGNEVWLGIYEPGRYVWELANAQPLKTLVPCAGDRRLWTPTDDVVAKVEAQR